MKKLVLGGLILGLVAANLIFAFPAHATSIHDKPFCYLVFWRDRYCKDKSSPSSPSNPSQPSNNNAPIWTNTQTSYSVQTGQTLQFTVTAVDPDNDPVSYSAPFLPATATFNPSTHTFAWVPFSNQDGTYQVIFYASDGKATVDLTVTITVSKPGSSSGNSSNNSNNQKPVWTITSDKTATVGKLLQITVSATDPDGDQITYSVIDPPAGSAFSEANRTLYWIPTADQIGFQTLTFRAHDGTDFSDMGIVVTVSATQPAAVNPNPPAPVQPAPTPIQLAPAPAPTQTIPVKLEISDVKISIDNGDVVVSWKTNIPSRARVIYDTKSQADKTENFTYANATPETNSSATEHLVNLGKLPIETVFYMRAVAKTNGQVVTSNEITFIILPGGEVRAFGLAALIGALGSFLTQPAILWLAIIILASYLLWQYYQRKKLQL